MSKFTRAALESAGFTGWTTFAALPAVGVPDEPGVYVVFRTTSDAPVFLDESPAGIHKGKSPTVGIDVLHANWVSGTNVVYIGKAIRLRKRLDTYRRHGAGARAAHWGGRYIWQCGDAGELLVAWKRSDGDPEDTEKQLLRAFAAEYGRLPFANLRL
jgi:hypothetical protein